MTSQSVDGTMPSEQHAFHGAESGGNVCTVEQIKQRLESITAQKEQLKLASQGDEKALKAVRRECLDNDRFMDLPFDKLDSWIDADLEAADLIPKQEDSLSQAEIYKLNAKVYGEREKSGEVTEEDVEEFIQSEKESLDREEAEERAILAEAEVNGGLVTLEMRVETVREIHDAEYSL